MPFFASNITKLDKMNLHYNLLHVIRENVPHDTSLAKFLMEILYLSKEAIYRRLRGEVPFTLEEAGIICNRLRISLDNIINANSARCKPFQLQLTSYVNPAEIDYEQMQSYIDLLRDIRKDTDSEIGSASNIFSQTLYLNYKYLAKFHMYKSFHQSSAIDGIRSLDDIVISDRLADLYKRYAEEAMQISKTYFIWDKLIFYYLVNTINYYARIHYITQEDVFALKEDLLNFIDYLEVLATKGQYDTGASLQLYLSDINFDSSYSYIKTSHCNFSHIKVFTMNSVLSSDSVTFDNLRNWIQLIKRLSVLISESGEMQRVQYFKEQRELVNSMGNNK